MTTILAAIFVFGVLITVHEFGHFITAKMTGMRVDEFAIGFGPNIFQKKVGETLYSLRIIPLGGYNKIAVMDPDEPAAEDSFKSKSIPARMLVILAGSLMNFLLPVILFFSIFMINGIQKTVDQPVLGTIMADKAAAKAGLQVGDRIISINGEKIVTWNDLVVTLQKYPDKEITVTAEHQGEVKNYQMVPAYDAQYGRPLIGISPKYEHYQPGIAEAAAMGAGYTKHIIFAMIDGLQKIITGAAPADVAGPIGVAKMAGEMAHQGMLPLLNFIAFLSINLGVINLLPLPALDGGHFALLLLEAVRGKPLGARATNAIQMVGVAIILSITVLAVFNDISR
ncbi:RIP metalloprotease RseP [Phascolarctobacterium sp.]